MVQLSGLLFAKEYFPFLAKFIREYYKRLNAGDKAGAMSFAYAIKSLTFDFWLKAFGWSLGNTPYFKRGVRDPDLGRGVAAERFLEFFIAITQKTKDKKSAELILTGHTHRSIEYTTRLEDKLIAFLHDYYIDNTVKDLPPSTYWGEKLPNYHDPLNTTHNKKNWWRQHSPLFVQTHSVCVLHGEKGKTGVLQINVKQNVINRIQRLNQPYSKHKSLPGQAYFILFSSPP